MVEVTKNVSNMNLSNSFLITRKENPSNETDEATSLLIRSGFIEKLGNGTYVYLPLGFKVLENIKKVIRDEMKKLNSYEMLMPSLVSEKYFSFTNRNELFDKELFKLNDRNNKKYCLCPTHEEIFSLTSKLHIESYKDLHFLLYQISNKYRNELNNEFGLIRKREFIMFDAYSFDTEEATSNISYDKMFYTFLNIFKKLSLDALVCESYAGDMLGSFSEEFQIITKIGDNDIVKCTSCPYVCNADIASAAFIKYNSKEQRKKTEKVKVENVKSIIDVAEKLNVDIQKIIKSLIYIADGEYKMILMRGNDKVNENKLKRLLKVKELSLASLDELESIGTVKGYIGPIKSTMQIIADNDVRNIINGICGSNMLNYYYINVNDKCDFNVSKYADIKYVDSYDLCPRCKGKIEILKGVEVGNIFKLDTSYSEVFDIKYLDEKNNYNYVHMGSYGIGIDRCMAVIAQMNHDENGIIWPYLIAPYKVNLILINEYDRNSKEYADVLCDKLNSLNIDTIIDDRDISTSNKYKDNDLIGIPVRIVINFEKDTDKVEVKLRHEENSYMVNRVEIVSEIKKILNI